MEKTSRAKKLNELMKKAGLSGNALAKLVGADKNEISRLRTEKRLISELWARRLAPYLGVTWPELLDWETAGAITLTNDEKRLVLAYRSLTEAEAKAHLEFLTARMNAQANWNDGDI